MRDYGNAYITYHLVHSVVLPKKGFPLVFHGVDSGEHHKELSPSWEAVCNYCERLTHDPLRKICGCGAILVAQLSLFTSQ